METSHGSAVPQDGYLEGAEAKSHFGLSGRMTVLEPQKLMGTKIGPNVNEKVMI